MNQILDIIATSAPADQQLAGKPVATGETAVPGMFDSHLSIALQNAAAGLANSENPIQAIIDPVALLTNSENSIQQPGTGPNTNMIANSALQTANQVFPVQSEATNLNTQQPISSSPTATATLPVAETILPSSRLTASVDLANLEAQINGALSNNLDPDQLRRLMESQLTNSTDKASSKAIIPSEVTISEETADAMAKAESETQLSAKSSANIALNRELLPNQTKGGLHNPAVSLKSALREAFPSLNISNASGKVGVELRTVDPQPTANATTDPAVNNANIKVASDLPLAAGFKLVNSVASETPAESGNRGRVKFVRNAAASPPKTESAKAEAQNEPRITEKSANRKPVAQNLKPGNQAHERLTTESALAKSPVDGSGKIEILPRSDSQNTTISDPVEKTLDLAQNDRIKVEFKRSHIEALLKRGEVKLQLHPEHLGSMKIRLTTSPNEVSARVETSSESARKAVELSLPQLKESLERAGFKVNSIELVVSNQSDSHSQQSWHQDTPKRNQLAGKFASRLNDEFPPISEITNHSLPLYGGALNLVA